VVAAMLDVVLVGGDDTSVIFEIVCNSLFCPMDVVAVAGGALLILFGAIFNFNFGLITAFALAFGSGEDFAFGGEFVTFFSFFFADAVDVFFYIVCSKWYICRRLWTCFRFLLLLLYHRRYCFFF
jgi:hypothetical protein